MTVTVIGMAARCVGPAPLLRQRLEDGRQQPEPPSLDGSVIERGVPGRNVGQALLTFALIVVSLEQLGA